MSQEKEFPQLPQDIMTMGYLQGLKGLSLRILRENPESDTLRAQAAYLFVVADAPVQSHYTYFRFWQAMIDEVKSLNDYYNHYIHSQGQNYMLDVLNREIGPFADYFNDFQILMHGFNQLAKQNEDYEPLDTLLWGFYSSLYDHRKRARFLKNAYDSLQSFSEEQSL